MKDPVLLAAKRQTWADWKATMSNWSQDMTGTLRRFVYSSWMLLALWCLSTGPLHGQVDTSMISGNVSDVSGAAIPGAKLTITNMDSGVSTVIVADGSGRYNSPPLKPGRYKVMGEATGFQGAAQTLNLEVGRAAAANLALPVEGSVQTVSVTSEAPLVATESSSVGVIRNSSEVQTIPINQRNAVRIIELTPGTVPTNTQAQQTGVSNYRGTALSTVNGQSPYLTNDLIDGVNNNDNHGGAAIVIYPLIESIGELRVFNTGADAQFGRSLGGIVDVVIKSGGKQFHGSGFEYVRNSALDARNYFTPKTSNATFTMNQFGGSFGGPLFIPKLYNNARNKTFFFGDYEGVRRNQSLVNISTLPTTAEVGGDFSALSTRIFDPLTGKPFPGNIIPTSRFNTAGVNYANLYPTPNVAGTASNFIYTPQRIFNLDDGDLKIDHYASDKLWFTVRLSGGDLKGSEPSNLPAPAIGAGPSFPGPQEQPHFQGDASVTKVFGAHLINEFRAGYSRLSQRSINTTAGTALAQQLGIPGINVGSDPNTSGNVSVMSVSGYQSLGDAAYLPGNVTSDSNQFSDIITFDHGKHIIKAGFEFQRRRYNVFQAVYPRGLITFAPYFTRNPATGVEGNAVADLLLGLPQTMRLDLLTGTRGLRRSEYAGFVQDSWKATSKLTFNIGLRYDFFDNKTGTEVDNRMAQFLPSSGQLYTVGSQQVPSLSGTTNSNLNFSPRIGLAYSPHSTTVIRASYGIYFAPMYVTLSQGLAFNPPFVGRETYANDATNPTAARLLSSGFTRTFAANGVGGVLNAIATNLPTPYNSLWDIGFEQQFPHQLVLAVDYVGSKSTHLQYLNDINEPVPGSASTASRRPFPNYSDIYMESTTGYANYNALQATLSRRFSKDLQFSESYTYSHCLDIADSGTTTDGQIQNPNNPNADYGNCSWDLRNRSVTTLSYGLPFGKGERFLGDAGHMTDALVGGWRVNVVGNFYSGFYFTPTNAANTTNSTGATQRPNVVAGCNPNLSGSARSYTHWFNTACYVSPALYTFGNAGRNSLLGPNTKSVDMSLFKTFSLTPEGRAHAQLQAQVFNIANTPQLNNPNASIGTASAGIISSAGSDATFARTARQVQLGVRVDF